MVLFGFNSRRYEMLMSAVLLVYATRHTATCFALGILIGTLLVNWLMIYVPAEVEPASVFAHLANFYTRNRC